MPNPSPCRRCFALLVASLLLFAFAAADNGPAALAAEPAVRTLPDIVYAEVGEVKLLLDLYLPANKKDPPLAIFVHGGSWRAGTRKKCPVAWLAEEGYALASIDYRLSQQAIFPAALHDCKGAVRWLRGHADEYGYNAERIAMLGSSAGGHLALLLGTSGGLEDLEGTVGGHLQQSSRVQAVVDYYGASDFLLRGKLQPANTEQPSGNVYQLLGGAVSENLYRARQASGVTHVSPDDPPLLILHGLQDNKVNPYQAVRIYQAYQRAGLPVQFSLLPDSGHGGDEFYTGERRTQVLTFLDRHLASPAKAASNDNADAANR